MSDLRNLEEFLAGAQVGADVFELRPDYRAALPTSSLPTAHPITVIPLDHPLDERSKRRLAIAADVRD
ncbi:hypothetical protein ONA91_33640 [Micromonospora sp. DR5-3]|uniref:hypothetical protein n=1 Tax=unclassified Micromonospora TaxID=2617518 RepID=UPI0011DB1281|nr:MULTISPECIES: hypothetical protein [unclassified Micromonospora]MCW3819398.1 hypothetical protein [Micromonospora sp. DR5-3]TYC20811.1 hypothetical protein FXF52_29375 [Micromonospora sp. MP36]